MTNDDIDAKFDAEGREIMDSTPIAATLKVRPMTMFERMRLQAIQASQLAQNEGFETLEEANDFNVGDDYEPGSPYEEQYGPDGEGSFEPPASVNELTGAGDSQEGSSPAEPSTKLPVENDSQQST